MKPVGLRLVIYDETGNQKQAILPCCSPTKAKRAVDWSMSAGLCRPTGVSSCAQWTTRSVGREANGGFPAPVHDHRDAVRLERFCAVFARHLPVGSATRRRLRTPKTLRRKTRNSHKDRFPSPRQPTNPLPAPMPIIGFSEMMVEETISGPSAARAYFSICPWISAIRQACARHSSMICSTSSKIEAGPALQMEFISVSQWILLG